MFETEFQTSLENNFKQIEDIIDSRKRLGLYNIPKRSAVNFKSRGLILDSRCCRFEEPVSANDGDSLTNSIVKQTDSEITVVRVKCQDYPSNRKTKWDMHDIAVPGDGSHLAESPSLVNLVTLVGDSKRFEGEEYLVPLSSWEPSSKYEEKSTDTRCYSDSDINNQSGNSGEKVLKNEHSDMVCSRPKWAGRISNFIRRHCIKSKHPSEMSPKRQN